MKSKLNPKYTEYKVLYNTSAYFQEISEKASELFIIRNNSNYFPEFILYHVSKYAGNDHLDKAVINIRRIDVIVCNLLRLTRGKCDEIKS